MRIVRRGYSLDSRDFQPSATDKKYSVKHVKAWGSMPRALWGSTNFCQVLIPRRIPTLPSQRSSYTFFETDGLLTTAHYTLHSIKKLVARARYMRGHRKLWVGGVPSLFWECAPEIEIFSGFH